MESLEEFNDFMNNVKNSEPSVRKVGKWLAERGFEVRLPESKYADSPEKIKAYLDDGDLEVEGKRVEIKHLTSHWTCKEDYPYPTFMICAKKPFDRAVSKGLIPFMYMIFNNDMTHMVVVSTENYGDWEIMPNVKDKRYSWPEDKYITSLDNVLWF